MTYPGYPQNKIAMKHFFILLVLCLFVTKISLASTSYKKIVSQVQPRIVKIFGAGGFEGLEAYQSGFLISADGYVLTMWSYVLDTEYITVTLDDGRKYNAKLVGVDPRKEIAVLKIDASDLEFFNLDQAKDADAGTRVLAFSNLYRVATGNEAASVLHGNVSVKTNLHARRGTYQTPYRGKVFVLDAITNNPGAAGGALTNRRGELLAMIGKELRNSLNNTWLNYAIPIEEIRDSVGDLIAGKVVTSKSNEIKKPKNAHHAQTLGLIMVPNVITRTPPYIDSITKGSIAQQVGLKPDDLVLLIGNQLIQSCSAFKEELTKIDRVDPIVITVMRHSELIEFTLKAKN